MERCEVESTRMKMDVMNGSKCKEVNTPIIEKIIKLRDEAAKMLGYPNHAAFTLEIRMAKTEAAVFKFLNELTAKLEEPAMNDIKSMLALKEKWTKQRGLPFDGKLNAWDWRFYDKLLLQTEYEVDDEKLRVYFPVERVISGVMGVYEDVLSVTFKAVPAAHSNVWHEDCRMFEVFDKQTANFMGHFYLDLFPREGKYGHAAEFDLVKGYELADGTRQKPVSAVVCNFTKPTANAPSLLTFSEVETFFHEFGHAMHELCTTTKHYDFSGTKVERDFVEAPSQMLENWCYDATVLSRVSGHYQDPSKPLPEDFRLKLIKAKNVNEAIKNRRQLLFGTFDMLAHTAPNGDVDTEKLWHKVSAEIGMFPPQPGTNGAAAFGHITGGYSAGYYGYLWSKVYSCDMFTLFKQHGVLNQELGRRYRDLILARGGSRDATDMIRDFLGREPNQIAFLEDIGAV